MCQIIRNEYIISLNELINSQKKYVLTYIDRFSNEMLVI